MTSDMRPDDVPAWLLELVKDHEGYVADGYVQCRCGWNDYGNETVGYNAHLLALVIPELALDFVAKASGGWKSVDYDKPFGSGNRVIQYSVWEIKKELLDRYDSGKFF